MQWSGEFGPVRILQIFNVLQVATTKIGTVPLMAPDVRLTHIIPQPRFWDSLGVPLAKTGGKPGVW